MSVKTKLKIVGFFLITLIILLAINLCLPKIDINLQGNSIISINLGEEYIEEGATAKLKSMFKTEKLKINISGKVDTTKVGKYIVVYKASTKHLKKEIIRIVNILDNVKPKIKIEGNVNACKETNLLDYNVKATDNYDGDISDKIKYRIKNGQIIFSVTDSSNNKDEIATKINYIDNEYPKISL